MVIVILVILMIATPIILDICLVKRKPDDGIEYRSLDSDGLYHNDNGPAIVYKNGAKSYYHHGKLHCVDGPAIVGPDGQVEYWEHGQRLLCCTVMLVSDGKATKTVKIPHSDKPVDDLLEQVFQAGQPHIKVGDIISIRTDQLTIDQYTLAGDSFFYDNYVVAPLGFIKYDGERLYKYLSAKDPVKETFC